MVRFARAAVVAALAVTASLVGVAPAHAAVIDANCVPPSSNVLTFNPPLSMVLTPTMVRRTFKYSPCRSQTDPDLVSGFSDVTFTINDMCPMLLAPGTANITITWNTGQTTTFTASRTATISGTSLIVNFTGTVTAGQFLGSNVQQQLVGSAVDLQNCLAGVGRVRAITSRVNLLISH
jgi:hypothetical protein